MAVVYRSHRNVMGTVASVHVHDQRPHVEIDAAVHDVYAELDRIEARFSTFRPTSEISRVNRGELALADCHVDVQEVMDACTWLEHVSDGAFSARRPEPPHALDPAGFVKGWAGERAAQFLDDAGLGVWYLSIGGDICTRGAPDGHDHWTFAIADPFDPSRAIASVDVPADHAIATSGTGIRGAHLWHQSTRIEHPPFVALTVIGPHLAWADAFATTAFAKGHDGLAWLDQFEDYTGFAVRADGSFVRAATMRVAD